MSSRASLKGPAPPSPTPAPVAANTSEPPRDSYIAKALVISAWVPHISEDNIKFLTVNKGDVIYVLEQDESGWWEGNLRGEVGVFPGSYVEILPDIILPEPITPTATRSRQNSLSPEVSQQILTLNQENSSLKSQLGDTQSHIRKRDEQIAALQKQLAEAQANASKSSQSQTVSAKVSLMVLFVLKLLCVFPILHEGYYLFFSRLYLCMVFL